MPESIGASGGNRAQRACRREKGAPIGAEIPPAVQRFRTDYRAAYLPRFYRGWLHFAFTTLGCLAVIGVAISRVHEVRWHQWLAIPLTFLLANAVEYLGHKNAMHKRVRGLSLVFRRHTLQHHHFYTHDAMAAESSRDFHMTLFPPVLLLFFLGAIAGPIAAALFVFVSANAGWLFLANAMGYFLAYEWLHFSYHLPPDSFVGRLWVVRVLRRHHTAHHDQALMGRWNFNITFPICDAILGTTHPSSRSPGGNGIEEGQHLRP